MLAMALIISKFQLKTWRDSRWIPKQIHKYLEVKFPQPWFTQKSTLLSNRHENLDLDKGQKSREFLKVLPMFKLPDIK